MSNLKCNSKSLFLVVLFILLLSSIVLWKNIRTTEFHSDESGWISSAYYYTDLLFRHDLRLDKWSCPECYAYGSMNMHLGKWIMGIPLTLYSNVSGQSFFGLWDVHQSRDGNIKEGRLPPPEILERARTVSIILGVLCITVVFAIGLLCAGLASGTIAALLLMTNALFITFATRAMTDISYNFFMLSCCFAAGLLLEAKNRRRTILVSALCGICTGLATSVKITGLPVLGAFFFLVLVYLGVLHKLRIMEIAGSLVVFGVFALGVIYILNPLFWPTFNQIHLSGVWHDLVALANSLVTGDLQRGGLTKRFPELYNLAQSTSHVLEFPRLFGRWNSYMNNQILEVGAGWQGSKVLSFHTSLAHYASFPMEWVFLVIGLVASGSKIGAAWRNKTVTFLVIPVLFFAANYLIVLTSIKLNWDRYYLSTVIASKPVIAIGITESAVLFYAYWQKLRRRIGLTKGAAGA